MSNNPLSGNISIDTTDFKTAISQINRGMRLIESDFRASAASLGDWASSADGLRQRIDALTGEIDLQQTKVALLKKEYERVAKEKGENSRAAENLLIRINKETEGLNKNERELRENKEALKDAGGESEKTGKKVKGMGDNVEKAERKTLNLSKALGGLSKAGKVAVGVLAGVSAAAGAAFAGISVAALNYVKDATLVAARFEQLSDVSLVVGKSLGITEDEILSTIKALRGQGIEAASSAEAVTKMMQANLDLAYATDLAGVAQNAAVIAGENSTETYDAIITAVTTLNTEMLRNRGIVFSSQSAYEDYAAANGLVASELTESQKQAAFMNAVIKAGIPINDAYATSMNNPVKLLGSLPRVFNDIAIGVGGPFTEGLTNVIKPFYNLVKGVSEMVSEGGSLRPILDTLGAGFAGFGDQVGGAITSLGPLLEMVGEMVSMLMGGDAEGASEMLNNLINSLLDMITGFGSAGEGGGGVNITNFLIKGIVDSLPRIMELGTSLLMNFINGIVERIPLLLEAGVQILTGLINGLLPQLPRLIGAAIDIIQTLLTALISYAPLLIDGAAELIISLYNGIADALPTLIPMAVEMIMTIVDTIVKNLPMFIKAGLEMVVELATGIAEALPELIPYVAEIIPMIVTTLLENLPMLLMAALNLLLALAQGIVDALPVLITAIPQIVETIVTMLIDNLPMLIIAAVEIITTLALGLVENIPLLLEAVVDIIKGIFNAFKETDWKSIGDQIVAGIKDGFLSKWDDFQRSITEKFNGLVSGIKGLLKIDSPSKLFAGIGENMALGLGGGFTDEMDKVNRQIRRTVGDLQTGWGFNGSMQLAPQGVGAGAMQAGTNVEVNVNKMSNEIDEYRLARRIADEIRKGR